MSPPCRCHGENDDVRRSRLRAGRSRHCRRRLRTRPAVAVPSGVHPVIAVTVDDIPEHGGMVPGETRLDLTRRLVAALKAEGVPAYGFVNGSPAQTNPDDLAALEHWAGAFPVGNHTWAHANSTSSPPKPISRRLRAMSRCLKIFRAPRLALVPLPVSGGGRRSGQKARDPPVPRLARLQDRRRHDGLRRLEI